MHYCKNCKNEFKEPVKQKTSYEEFYGVSHLFSDSHNCEIEVCPVCGSDEFEEMKKCDVCEEYCLENDLTDTTEYAGGGIGDICPQCMIDCEVGC